MNHSLPWPTEPQAYRDTAIGPILQRVCLGLGDFRGHRDFIKSPQVPLCDYYVADPPFILEFDESQHFSRARSITLACYPTELTLGFSVFRWRQLCRDIGAIDDIPFDRDERRAWYDTLRDLVPHVHGFKPTIRLYADEFLWCSLDANSNSGIETFQKLLHDRLPAVIR
ncbi:MAG: hypothetical protein ACREQO_20755 [Candidatus Binatia bacterium]